MENRLSIEQAILECLGYFDYFQYPLRQEELLRCLARAVTPEQLEEGLQLLQSGNQICMDQNFIALCGREALFERRLKSNALAEQLLPRAGRVGHFLYGFPFVRFIGISGSLSKLYADEKTDFDFFIVCAPQRLWIARSLMHAFKKLTFLVNRQKYYCMNYYLDKAQLRIKDENRYTAIELITLIPVVNQHVYEQLIEANTWLGRLAPNFSPYRRVAYKPGIRPFKWMMEGFFNLLFPSGLNRFLMKITDKKWRKKWKKAGFPDEDYELAFRTEEHVSKNHPANYQKQVLQAQKYPDRQEIKNA